MKRILGLIPMLFLGACGFEVVDTGHRGVETRFGKVVSESLPEGLHFYNPLTSNIIEMDVRTQRYEVQASAYSEDAQVVELIVTVNLNLSSTAAHVVYPKVGQEWAEKIVGPILQGLTKGIVGQNSASELISNRNAITNQLRDELKARLSTENIDLTNLEISNLDLDDSFEAAVRNKVVAVEKAKEAQNKTVTIEEEAKQKVIAAKAEAESMRIRSQALKENKGLVEYEAVQKWSGKLPDVMIGGGSVPFINIDKLTGR